MRPSWDEWGLALAHTVGTRADCTRRQVGCALLDADRRVIATGYNGAPAGAPGCLSGACPRGQLTYDQVREHADYDTGPGRCVAVHAEMNALLWARQSVAGATVYITHPPCPGCSKHLAAARVARVVWPDGERINA